MTYRDRTRDLAASSEAQSLSELDRQRPTRRRPIQAAAPFIAAVISSHNARAAALADLALTAVLRKATGRPIPALGLSVTDDEPGRLAKAVRTVFDETDEPGPRLARLARAEPLQAGRRAFAEGMRRRGVPGWTRNTGPDPCPLCQQLNDGSALPPTVEMADHPGCSCTAVPVLTRR